ncbi:unnamed protein product [Caenorhabditis brenneri]
MTENVEFAVQRFDLRDGREDLFSLNNSQLQVALSVPWERVKIRSGLEGQLVLFDRTIVQGEIPIWMIRLREDSKSFLIFHHPIGTAGDDSERNSSLFTIAVDPINRCFAKLMGPRKMLVFTESRGRWTEYVIPPEDSLDSIFGTDGFPVEDNRSLRETYGIHGHRVGAMQTRLTFHDLGGTVVARFLHVNKKNTTVLVDLDHQKQEIKVRKLAGFNLDDSVAKMFYLMANSDIHVFLGVHHSAVVHIRSPTLEELVGWKLQKMLLKDGYFEEVCQVTNFQQLLALSYAKYSENDDTRSLEQHLKSLGIHEPMEEMDIELD